ncbi:hypothetical protein ACOSQ3_011197 [Xanthoceras sorbifolium]
MILLGFIQFAVDFRRAHLIPPSLPVSSLLPVPHMHWQPPPVGVFSVNTDAAIRTHLVKIGLGVIIRNSVGKVLACCCSCLNIICSPPIAEALAMIRGLHLAEDLLLLPASLNPDALSVINLIYSAWVPASELGLLISDILELFLNPSFHGVNFIPRSANFVAHDLANFAFSFSTEQIWLD